MVLEVLTILAALPAGTPAAAEDVVLRIGDSAVTRAEFTMVRRVIESRLGPNRPDETGLLRMAVDQIVTTKMLAAAARKNRVRVMPAEVAQRLAASRARYASPEEYARSLEKLSLDEAQMARIEEEQLLVQRFIAAQIAPLASVTEEEAKAYYAANTKDFTHPEQVKLRMILFKVASDADADAEAAARARADKAIQRLKDGEDFAELASEVSEAEATREKGGELIWARRGLLAPDLESAAFALEPGETTGAIRTSHGYHILKLEARRPPGISSYEEIRERLFQFLKGRNSTQLIRDVVSEMLASNPVEALDPAIKAVLDAPQNAEQTP